MNNLIQTIKLNSKIAGISSEEVSLAKTLVENKCKDRKLFVCEGLWAVDKLIEKNIKVTHFLYNGDKLDAGKIDEKSLEKIAKMSKYSANSYAISEKACKKISDRDGYDEYFIVAFDYITQKIVGVYCYNGCAIAGERYYSLKDLRENISK